MNGLVASLPLPRNLASRYYQKPMSKLSILSLLAAVALGKCDGHLQ